MNVELLRTLVSAPLRTTDSEALPWIPSPVPGKSSKPLRFLRSNRGFVEYQTFCRERGMAMRDLVE